MVVLVAAAFPELAPPPEMNMTESNDRAPLQEVESSIAAKIVELCLGWMGSSGIGVGGV